MTLRIASHPTYYEVQDLQQQPIAKSLSKVAVSYFSYNGCDYMFVPPPVSMNNSPWIYELKAVQAIEQSYAA